jgi:hypothetical protein
MWKRKFRNILVGKSEGKQSMKSHDVDGVTAQVYKVGRGDMHWLL